MSACYFPAHRAITQNSLGHKGGAIAARAAS